MELTRRDFIRRSAIGVSGLLIAFHLPTAKSNARGASSFESPNAFIHLLPDNTVELIINRLEMGQGIHTSLAMLIAEELDLNLETIICKSSGADPVYNDPKFHVVTTQGSLSVNHSWDQYRQLGAGMRQMLLAAAAKRLKVTEDKLRTSQGFVIFGEERISYGALAEEAQKLPFPKNIKLKSSSRFTIIGKAIPAFDAKTKVNGSALYGTDVRLKGMLFATLLRSPFPTSKILSLKIDHALRIKGVTKVLRLRSNKIAVVATSTYSALKGKEAVQVEWSKEKVSSNKIIEDMKAASMKKGLLVKETALKSSQTEWLTVSASYSFPYLAHAPMEPLNCTVDFDGKTATFYGGFQRPTEDLKAVTKVLGLKETAITFEVTYAGGSFGRRDSKNSDWVVEAAEVAKELRKPVQVFWDRQDDIQGGHYRPMALHKVSVSLSKSEIIKWQHHIVGHPILKKNPIEGMLLQGIINSTYQIPGLQLEQTLMDSPVETLWWRSVGHSHTAFVMETLMDELAEKFQKDPIDFRLEYLESHSNTRRVLEKMKVIYHERIKQIVPGRKLGFAVHTCAKTVVAYLSEVSIVDKRPQVHRVWAVVDCGKVVNPTGAAAQIEGGIVFGISSLFQEITITDGKVLQSNFDDFPALRISEMPVIETFFIESEAHPTGLGESGVPPIAPAVANALHRITGERLRSLPLKPATT